jgi:hypothetical protein
MSHRRRIARIGSLSFDHLRPMVGIGPLGDKRMHRLLYLTTLLILQLALIGKLAPPLAQALRLDLAPGLAPGGWPAMLQLVATAAAIAGTSLVLVFPLVAMARHRRGGGQRFDGLPKWAITLALAGAIGLAAGFVAQAFIPMLPVDLRMTAVLVTRPVVAGGLALATAGVLSAELLRRSVLPARAVTELERQRSGRVEVTHPPELRTRTV